MHRVLREHAMILRSQADELDAMADVLAREADAPGNMQTLYTPVYQSGPPIIDPDDLPGDMTIAEPDGRVDATYLLHDTTRVNEEATLRAAKHEALQGKIVFLDYGDPKKNQIWTKETFD
jgi:hypothetical protein